MFATILIFILVLGVLVLVHEFGHFIVAKKSGMKVEEFGFGFPPRLFGVQNVEGRWKMVWGHKTPPSRLTSGHLPLAGEEKIEIFSPHGKGESVAPVTGGGSSDSTIYSINWIPFGGFVRIMGENNEKEHDPRSFINKPFWPRFFTLVAGVIMNWLLAVVLFSIIFMAGFPVQIDPDIPLPANAHISHRQVAISGVVKGGAAEAAGLLTQDIIQTVDGQPFETYAELQEYIHANKGKELVFIVQRLNESKTISVQSLANPPMGQGPTGISLAEIGTVQLPFFSAIKEGVVHTVVVTKLMAKGVFQLITGKVDLNSVGGPVKIAQLTGQVADLGFLALMNFTAFLSINLAILNILPLPALDGGRVLFLLIEKIRRKRNSQKAEQFVNTVGFVFLLLLMLLVTIKDVRGL